MSLGPLGIPGFVGVAQRGPTNQPVRLHSILEFRDAFGHLEEAGYLEQAVDGFFENGGKTCYVLRVAHAVSRRGEEVARAAMLRLRDANDRPVLVVRASNEGAWGDRVRLSVERPEPRVSTFLTLDLREGDTSAVIKSTHGLSRGSVIRIRDHQGETCRIVTDLSGKNVSWAADAPLERNFASGAPTYIEPVEFNLVARWSGVEERYSNLSMSPISDHYVERAVNERSKLIQVQDLREGAEVSERFPAALGETLLEGGRDGLFTVTPDDFIGMNIGPEERYGLAALEAVDEIDILAAPDLMWALAHGAGFRTEKDVEVVQDAMISQCERLKTRFAILDFPDPADHRRAEQWRLLFDSPYGAFYFPWIRVDGPAGQRLIPPSGHIAGIYSRCDLSMGTFRAPANEVIEGIFDVARDLRDEDIGQLNDEGINCLKSFSMRGIRVWGARTTSSDPAWRYLNVRRVMNTVISSVERGLQWSVFETNSPVLWKSLERQVTMFLLELWQLGYFKGPTPEEAFFVKCDEETNPPEAREAGQVIVECGVAPVRPAEYLVFRVAADVEAVGPGT
ncbi:MAG: phage tail sheath family protein [Deltaproteobacteria bacterium]|nr:phage tail sheath family protein [Deltaproteobacteria bacterium]MCB9785928.1 phage tail sheath family protein [Deltaproteobacteria bacterium]